MRYPSLIKLHRPKTLGIITLVYFLALVPIHWYGGLVYVFGLYPVYLATVLFTGIEIRKIKK